MVSVAVALVAGAGAFVEEAEVAWLVVAETVIDGAEVETFG